ncbi:zinc finger MYM-type protein 1-like, partial [Aphis craccivora]
MSPFSVYSILVDETKDSSKKEHHMKKSDATSLAQEIVKLIQKNNLDINKCIA